MWLCCGAEPRKLKTWTFKNGTRVKATDSAHAIQILKSISLRDVTKIFQMDSHIWRIDFGKGVFIEVQEQEQVTAKKLGEWRVYLDRREPSLVHGQ